MWPCKKRKTGERAPRSESELALDAARQGLEEAIRERAEVSRIAGVVRVHLEKNHISERIGMVLRGAK